MLLPTIFVTCYWIKDINRFVPENKDKIQYFGTGYSGEDQTICIWCHPVSLVVAWWGVQRKIFGFNSWTWKHVGDSIKILKESMLLSPKYSGRTAMFKLHDIPKILQNKLTIGTIISLV